MSALKGYFESNQCDKILNTIKKHLKINDIEMSNIVDEYLKDIKNKREEDLLEFENGERLPKK